MFLIGIPLNDGNLHIETMKSIMNFQDKLMLCGVASDIEYNIGSLITRQRNDILKKFMENEKYDYLLFIDNDVSNFEDYILDNTIFLKDYEKSICGLTYRKKTFNNGNENIFNVNLKYSIQHTLKKHKNNFIKVKHIPTGCLLIPKTTMNEMMKYYPNRAKTYNFFDVEVVDDIYLSEDYFFCHLLNLMGGSVISRLDTNVKHHLSNICFDGTLKEYLNNFIQKN
tara:strand:- start:2400 stop:3074 length:675 start_codon:yes stop_codon:yes gene_type:complete